MSDHDDLYQMEEDFFSTDKKTHRKERKLAEQGDRSQFKKSDQDQLKKHNLQRAKERVLLPKGRVLTIALDGILIDYEGKEIVCTLKGTLKHEKSKTKNLVAVGDFVYFEPKESHTGTITAIEERKSILSRADNLSRHKEQLIAVNIDQVLITCSVVHPALKTPLIDRYIIAAQKGNMQPIIIINKIDLLQTPPLHISPLDVEVEKEIYAEFLRAYSSLGIPIFPVSVITEEGIDLLYQVMQGKSSVFSGQSGTGKSSLINLIVGTNIRTGSIVQKTGKGSHTTTSTQLLPLQGGGFCIDTPGIKSFGLWDLKKEDILNYFPEFLTLSYDCRYQNCSHLIEPDCAVKKAIEEELISPLRFESYCALMASISQKHRLR